MLKGIGHMFARQECAGRCAESRETRNVSGAGVLTALVALRQSL